MKKRYCQSLLIKHLCFLFAIGTIFYACNSPTAPEEPESRWWEPLLAEQDSFSKDTSPLELSLTLSGHKISTDDSLTITLNLHNISGDSLVFYTSGGGTANYDLVVLQPDSSFVWNRFVNPWGLQYDSPLAEIQMLLAPDESKTFEKTWNLKNEAGNRVEEGTYLVFGGFLHFGYDLFSNHISPDKNEKIDLGPVATEMQEIVVE